MTILHSPRTHTKNKHFLNSLIIRAEITNALVFRTRRNSSETTDYKTKTTKHREGILTILFKASVVENRDKWHILCPFHLLDQTSKLRIRVAANLILIRKIMVMRVIVTRSSTFTKTYWMPERSNLITLKPANRRRMFRRKIHSYILMKSHFLWTHNAKDTNAARTPCGLKLSCKMNIW